MFGNFGQQFLLAEERFPAIVERENVLRAVRVRRGFQPVLSVVGVDRAVFDDGGHAADAVEGIAAVDCCTASCDALRNLSSEHIIAHVADRAVSIYRADEVSGVVILRRLRVLQRIDGFHHVAEVVVLELGRLSCDAI